MAALPIYRSLLRAIRVAFEGDVNLISSARVQARDSFNKSRFLDPSSKDAVEALEHAGEVAKLLRHNILQGQKKEGDEILKLRIHKDIERGDNNTVKVGGKKITIGQPCS